MGTVGLFRYFLEVRPSRGSWHSDRHCTCVCVGVCVGGWVGVWGWVCVCGCLLGCVVGWSLDSFTSPCFDGRAAKSLQGCMCVRFEMAACLSTDAVLPLRELAGEMPYLLQR